MDFVKGLVGRGKVRKTLKPHRSFNLYFLCVPFPFFFFFFFLHLYSLSTSLPILLPSFIRLSGHKFTVSITADRNNAGLFRPLRIVACSTFKVLKNQFFFSIGENAVKNTGGGGASGVAGNKTARTTTGREEGKKKGREATLEGGKIVLTTEIDSEQPR